jgi:hypothetical protein
MIKESDSDGRVTLPWADYIRLVKAQALLKRVVDADLAHAKTGNVLFSGSAAEAIEYQSAAIAAIEFVYPHMGDKHGHD